LPKFWKNFGKTMRLKLENQNRILKIGLQEPRVRECM
jgi:hypothetical protein